MGMHRFLAGLALTVGFVASGCMAGDVDAENPFEEGIDVPVQVQGGIGDPEDDPPASMNYYEPSCFWSFNVQIAYRSLATGALVDAQGRLPTNKLSGLPAGACRDQALRYLARCALPQGTAMYDSVSNTYHRGWLGVAPGWQTQALTTESKQWMTSCLLQHLNGVGAEVPILLEANRAGFYQTASLQASFPLRDAIFWGNLFDSTVPPNPVKIPPFTAYGCYMSDLAAECYGGANAATAVTQRVCDESAQCGLQPVGNCAFACTWNLSIYSPSYWSCGNMKSFRSRLKDDTMYSTICGY